MVAKPNLFYKIDESSDFIPIRRLDYLNKFDSGNHTLNVYKHDGLQYAKVSSFGFWF
jgi:hypothetical protein